ncbi:MAG: ATPase, T2SS/T4P/T4SS family [bacterium]
MPEHTPDQEAAAVFKGGTRREESPLDREEAAPFPDVRSEMEALIRKESADRETVLSREIDKKGEAGGKFRVSAPSDSSAAGTELVTTDMHKLLAQQAGLPFVNLSEYKIGDPEVLKLLPSEFCKANKVFPIQIEEDGSLLVAISDPLNITIVDDMRLLVDRNVTPVITLEEDILEQISVHYGIGDETLEQIVENLDKEGAEDILKKDVSEVELDLASLASAPPVIRLVNLILMQAVKDRASDLHVEPFAGVLRIRYRVDGVLREIPSPPKSLQLGLTSRFKVMANMNISESRRPQDGRIKLTQEGREIELRVSTIPTVHGESIVMRVLDKSLMMIGISQIGMMKDVLGDFLKVIRKPNGIVLVTGPTGCGKTTTLYASIREINDPGEKLITTEDPVEYQLDGIVQVNINENVGLTFPACLRSILRQDPDIILVGEIRDVETSQIAIQASLTGHLVFSTLHTNSAAATITRLIDMGTEPFLISSTLEAIVGQRLVRTICPRCKTSYSPPPEEMEEFNLRPEDVEGVTFFRGEGCEECGHTGYKGRMGLFELIILDDDIRALILERPTTDEIHEMAVRKGMKTMRQDGWLKILLGLTTFEEVARQTPKESKEIIEAQMKFLRAEKHAQENFAEPAGPPAEPPAAMPKTMEDLVKSEQAMPPYEAGDAATP